MHVHQTLNDAHPVDPGPLIRHRHVSAPPQRFTPQEEIGGAVPFVLEVMPARLPRLEWSRLSGFPDELLADPVQIDERTRWGL